MGRFYNFLLGVVVGFALYHAVLNYHVIRASDGFHLVAKRPPRLTEAYVDIRNFGWEDWQQHPQVIVALEAADKRHLLTDAARDAAHELIDRGLQQVLPDEPPAP